MQELLLLLEKVLSQIGLARSLARSHKCACASGPSSCSYIAVRPTPTPLSGRGCYISHSLFLVARFHASLSIQNKTMAFTTYVTVTAERDNRGRLFCGINSYCWQYVRKGNSALHSNFALQPENHSLERGAVSRSVRPKPDTTISSSLSLFRSIPAAGLKCKQAPRNWCE